MEWYWWVLVAIGVVAIGYVKLKVWGQIQKNMAEKKRIAREGGDF